MNDFLSNQAQLVKIIQDIKLYTDRLANASPDDRPAIIAHIGNLKKEKLRLDELLNDIDSYKNKSKGLSM